MRHKDQLEVRMAGFTAHPRSFPNFEMRGICTHIISDIKYVVMIDLGFDHYAYQTVILKDAESFDRSKVEQLVLNKPVILQSNKVGDEWHAIIWYFDDGEWLNLKSA